MWAQLWILTEKHFISLTQKCIYHLSEFVDSSNSTTTKALCIYTPHTFFTFLNATVKSVKFRSEIATCKIAVKQAAVYSKKEDIKMQKTTLNVIFPSLMTYERCVPGEGRGQVRQNPNCGL